ncbi:MAG: DegT/DnrJ/EryC1/StrS family aminotransferase [Nitrospirae bacterium]|nr:DegT/DnrJ/EryC1/StrS family aminotransferase [Nitrospirota bacterium]
MSERFIKVAIPLTGEEEAEAIREVVLSGHFVSGQKVEEFEKNFASYLGVVAASAVNSGTAALHIAMAVLGIGPGQEVIVPSLTFMSTVTSVLHQNAVPIFADIDKDSFCISPDDIKKRITSRTRAIIPVHYFGNAANMDEIMDIAQRHGLHVIEDCAQSHGTLYKGKKTGSIGHMGVFSFFATKHMTTGEGGIITSNNEEWIKQANIIRSHGLINRDDHVCLGYNYRMNEMAAAMGLVQLKKLDGFNGKRIKNSLFILNELTKRRQSWFRIPKLSSDIKHTFFWCPLVVRSEDGYKTEEVVKKLRDKGIEVRQRYKEPLYKQKIILDYKPYPGGCPFACLPSSDVPDYASLYLPNVEALSGNIIGLPNHPVLTDEDLIYIVDTIASLY